MYYREFREEILHLMKEQAGGNMKLSLVDKQKLNGQRWWGLLMEKEGSPCSPVIYLENAYEDFGRGMPLSQIVERLWSIYEEESEDTFNVLKGNIADMDTFEAASKKLFVRIFHRERNLELLDQTPFVPVLDLAITAYYLVEEEDASIRGTVMIKEEHLQNWGVTREDVFACAMKNSLDGEGIYWNTIEEVMKRHKLLEFPHSLPYGNSGLHVLSNRSGVWGAVMAFLPGIARRLYEAVGEEFYLLPSSIHEVLFIPVSRAFSRELLQRTVRDVNRYEMQQEEILSDHVYYYHSGEDRIEIADI